MKSVYNARCEIRVHSASPFLGDERVGGTRHFHNCVFILNVILINVYVWGFSDLSGK